MPENQSHQSDVSVALDNCDREPIHTIGQIQPFGALFAFSSETSGITHASENLCALFPGLRFPETDDTLKSFIPEADFRHAIRGAMGLPTIREQRESLGCQTVGGKTADVGVYQAGSLFVVEMQPVSRAGKEEASRQGVAQLRSLLAGLETGRGLDKLLRSAASLLRNLTGFDRVMVYRFLPSGDGEVAAEACGPGVEPFLGLRYPASDIPVQVRQVMLRATSRVIRDIDASHSAVQMVSESLPLDLSLSQLRGVSPIHVEYLRNMGVQATMNVSLISNGQLWGLFALHHYRARSVTPAVVAVMEVFGQLASMQIHQEIEREAASKRTRLNDTISSIPEDSSGLNAIYEQHGEAMVAAAELDGMAAVNGNEIVCFGSTPSEQAILLICEMSQDLATTYESLAATGRIAPEALRKTAGAIVQRSGPSTLMLFFRDEIRHQLRWAGDPNKKITYGPNGPRLEPRSSFREYTEQVSQRCQEWTRSDESVIQYIGGVLARYLLKESSARREISERAKGQQDLLIAELNHRVRNTLALVQSLARQSSTDSKSVEQYVDSLEQRIRALASAHSLVGASGQQWARFSDVVSAELAAYDGLCPSIVCEGPALALKAEIAPIVTLLIHELTSNAVKHGAMSGIGESLHIAWGQSSVGATFRWRETLTTEVGPPERHGFGLTLLERAIPHECHGKTNVQIGGRSVEVELWLPDEVVTLLPPVEDHAHSPTQTKSNAPVTRELGDALILEDNMVLALEMEKALHKLGTTKVDSVSSINQAHDALQRGEYDLALMDINLGKDTSFEVAQQALTQGVAVVFVTGYDSGSQMPEKLRQLPRLTKPVNHTDLQFAVNQAIEFRDRNETQNQADTGNRHAE